MILTTSPIIDLKHQLTSDNNQQTAQSFGSLADAEKDYIHQTLKHCHWRIGGKGGAASILGVPDSTLRSKMKKLQITRPI